MTATISDSSPGARGGMTPRRRLAGADAARGRAAQLKIIGDLLCRARRGSGGVVLVDGEPGSGKSLLLRCAIDEAGEQGFSLAAGAADELGQAIPFFTLREALGQTFAGPGTDDPSRDMPGMAAWSIAHLAAHLERLAAVAPVLVCLDDLHWAEPATLTALRALPRDLKRHPVAWLLARSSTSQHRADHLFRLLEADGATRVTLALLSEDVVEGMLIDAFGAPPDQDLSDLARGAAGNPELVAELIAGLRDDRAVRVTGGYAVLASDRLPRRVRLLAQRRLAGLGKLTRQLLAVAAVLGPVFRLEDAAAMLLETPATLLPAVDEAIDAAIMTATESALTFRHQLLCRAVAEMIPPPARQAVHRQCGEILLARGESAVQAADHLLRAAHPDDPVSVAGLDQAAVLTLGTAPQTAAGLALRALELTPPADPAALPRAVSAAETLTAAGQLDQASQIARDTLAKPLPAAAEDRMRCTLASVLCASGQARDAAEQAQMVLARPGLPGDVRDRALAARLQALAGLHHKLAGPLAGTILAAPGQSGRHAAVAARLTRAVISWDSGQIGDALELLREAARHPAAISPDARHPQPLLVLASALIDLRQVKEAEDTLGPAGKAAWQNIPAGAAQSLLRARIHLAGGLLADAAADARAAITLAQALGAHGYAAAAYSVLSMIELRRGDLAAAARHIACRTTAGAQYADIYAQSDAATAEAQITEACHGPAAVVAHLRRLHHDLPARCGLLVGDPVLAAWLTRTALATGDSELATTAAGLAQSLADAHQEFRALAAAAAHSQGLARCDQACLAEAAALHPDPWARASAAEDLGVLHGRQGDRDQAIHHLKEALSGYRQAGARRDDARVRQRLRQHGIRRRHWTTPAARPVTGWASLTATEQTVAGLVAEGLSNNQIGARMYISTHTVAYYLRHVFRKLNIASRIELARIVIEQTADGAAQSELAEAAPPTRLT